MNPADVCTPESHEQDKRSFAPTLEYKGDQFDEDGNLELIYLHCLLCESTLAVQVPDHQRAPGDTPYAPTNRRPAMAPPAESAGPVGSAPSTSSISAAETPGGRGHTPRRFIITQPVIDHAGIRLAGDCALGHQFEQETHSDRVVAEQLGATIARRHRLVEIAIFTENREPRVVAARKELCEVLRAMRWSFPRIGRAIDRHHTSVISLLRSDAATSSPP